MSDFIPWNDPLREEVEKLVKRYNAWCQTHMDSDAELNAMILHFVQDKTTTAKQRIAELEAKNERLLTIIHNQRIRNKNRKRDQLQPASNAKDSK